MTVIEETLHELKLCAFALAKAEEEFERAKAYGRDQSLLGERWIICAEDYFNSCRHQLRNRTNTALGVADPVQVSQMIIDGTEAARK